MAPSRSARKPQSHALAPSAKRTDATPGPRKATRPPILRIHKLKALILKGDFPSSQSLARALEVSAKTILRDLHFMRDQLNLPLEYDSQRFGYHFTGPVAWSGSLDVSEGELVAILIAQKALQQYRGTVFEKPLLSACRKIEEALGGLISVQWSELDEAFSFKETGASEVSSEVFDCLGQAIRACHELRFEYQKLGSHVHEPRWIQPFHMGCINAQWYLFGYDLDRSQMRTFAVARLQNPVLQPTLFEKPAAFSIADYLRDSLTVFRGAGAPEEVRIQFAPWAAGLVRGRKWHESQKLTELPGGALEIELQLAGLEEVERWVLGFGEHAHATHPPALVERLRQRTHAMAERYAPSPTHQGTPL